MQYFDQYVQPVLARVLLRGWLQTQPPAEDLALIKAAKCMLMQCFHTDRVQDFYAVFVHARDLEAIPIPNVQEQLPAALLLAIVLKQLTLKLAFAQAHFGDVQAYEKATECPNQVEGFLSLRFPQTAGHVCFKDLLTEARAIATHLFKAASLFDKSLVDVAMLPKHSGSSQVKNNFQIVYLQNVKLLFSRLCKFLALCPRRGYGNPLRLLDFLCELLGAQHEFSLQSDAQHTVRLHALRLGYGFPNLYARRLFFSLLESHLLFFRDVFDSSALFWHEEERARIRILPVVQAYQNPAIPATVLLAEEPATVLQMNPPLRSWIWQRTDPRWTHIQSVQDIRDTPGRLVVQAANGRRYYLKN